MKDQEAAFQELKRSFLHFSVSGKPYLFHTPSFDLFELDSIAESVMGETTSSSPSQLSTSEWEALEELLGLNPSPSTTLHEVPLVRAISLELNHVCNLRCQYCYVFSKDQHQLPLDAPKQMKWETAKSVLDYFLSPLPQGSPFFIRLFGGEPLLSFPLIKKIVEYVDQCREKKSLEIEYMLISNGTILNEEIEEFLKKHEVHLGFSIDGPSKQHDILRPTLAGKGSFEKIEMHRRKLASVQISNQPMANVVVNKKNPDMFENFLSLRDQGYESVHFNLIFTDNPDFQLDVQDFPRLKAEYEKFKRYLLEDFPSRLPETPLISDLYRRIIDGKKRTNYCGAGKEYLGVGMDGGFYPCHRFVGSPKFKLGDSSSGLSEELRSKFLLPHIESRPICRACPVRTVCGGGCGHSNLLYRGSIEEPRELFCLLKKWEVECALYLLIQSQQGGRDETLEENKEAQKRSA
ncbi:MAG TPA: SPASM domain-containing protein [Chlamydiales bacterium]|nr:SPASM domain-containing protein [Chlamydiales bacterium]